jgi:hypothetical protein
LTFPSTVWISTTFVIVGPSELSAIGCQCSVDYHDCSGVPTPDY